MKTKNSSSTSNQVDGIPIDELVGILKNTAFFSEFEAKLIKEVAECITVESFPLGKFILKEGEINHKLYFIMEGILGVFVRGLRVATLQRKGEVIGEMSLVSDRLCTASVLAETDARLISITLEGLRNKSQKAFEIFEQSQFRLLTATLVEKLIETNEKARRVELLNSELEKKVDERTAELKNKNEILERTLMDNKSLVRILCHDLRNAITVVEASTKQALSRPNLDPAQSKKIWERVDRAVKKETEIIAFVRDMIAVESGKVQLELRSINIHDVIENARFIFQDRLAEKNINLEINIDAQISVIAEPLTLSNSVFNNLISNAIKFSQPGGTISINLRTRIEDTVTVTIKDHGIGIPKELLNQLFSPDKKTSRVGTSGEVGTGFGMPLVKTYIEAYGGSIQVESICQESRTANEESGTTMILQFKTKLPAEIR